MFHSPQSLAGSSRAPVLTFPYFLLEKQPISIKDLTEPEHHSVSYNLKEYNQHLGYVLKAEKRGSAGVLTKSNARKCSWCQVFKEESRMGTGSMVHL